MRNVHNVAPGEIFSRKYVTEQYLHSLDCNFMIIAETERYFGALAPVKPLATFDFNKHIFSQQ